MPVNLIVPEHINPVAGVTLSATAAGLKKNGEKDLVLVKLAEASTVAGVFTQNAYCAAPVVICREHLAASRGSIEALLINSGGANAATGEQGERFARLCCENVATQLGIDANQVLPFSTGVIGEQLPIEKLQSGIDELVNVLDGDRWIDAATGIMTTDTTLKLVTQKITLSTGEITISGFAKGSGMIEPNMATMLAFLFTDAQVEPQALQQCLHKATQQSFNSITVDGDTSTNDSFILAATGQTQSGVMHPEHKDWTTFCAAIESTSLVLAQAIVRDGEGASKFITVEVNGAASTEAARQVGLTVGNSPLVKTAFFASDANVGRIIMAVGRSGVADLDINRLSLRLGDVDVLTNGQPAATYTEQRGSEVMSKDEITVHIDLGLGNQSWTVYACDFSHDYVSINADYRS